MTIRELALSQAKLGDGEIIDDWLMDSLKFFYYFFFTNPKDLS
jgi:hypothetical protein